MLRAKLKSHTTSLQTYLGSSQSVDGCFHASEIAFPERRARQHVATDALDVLARPGPATRTTRRRGRAHARTSSAAVHHGLALRVKRFYLNNQLSPC